MTDLELALRVQDGDLRAADLLVRRYERAARAWACGYYLPGAERADVEQEARIGVLRAARSYRPSEGPFRAFARLCVRRQLIEAVKRATTQRQAALSHRADHEETCEGEVLSLIDVQAAPNTDPLDRILERDTIRRLVAGIQQLSALERRALVGVCLEGRPYVELGGKKAIDNAIQRARQSLREAA